MKRSLLIALASTSTLIPWIAFSSASAQTVATNGTLDEVVVTATRRVDTVHNIPLSITAISPQQVERQGLKNAQDLVQSVTSLRISPVNGGGTAGSIGNPDIAVRGIRSTTGAATTGIYVDDVPLQQRSVSGPSGGGTVFPDLFDLERVEVLKGPQGTLYGGSSEGGTIRFITPSPSFGKMSFYGKAEVATVDQGAISNQFGVAAGGPIVADKLAFRVSASSRHDGGYIDHVSQFSGALLPGGENTNSANHFSLHASVAWKPTDRSTVTLSYLYVENKYRDSDQYWENIPQFQTYFGPGTPGVLTTIGPFNMFGPYKTGQNTNVGKNFYTSDAQLKPLLSPHSNRMSIPSLTLDYAFDKMNVKSVTAVSQTKNRSTPDFSYVDPASRSVTPLESPYNTLPNNSGYIPNLPLYSSVFDQTSQINALSEELRFSSNNPDSPLNWVAGVFYDYTRLSSTALITANTGALASAALTGSPVTLPPFASLNGVGLNEPQQSNELQLAAFGEATYKVTDKLRVTAGLRYTRDTFNYKLYQGGALFGLSGQLVQIANGSVTESPLTPKVGVQWVENPNLNFYANASKGFRPGGVNQAIPPACQAGLTAAGYANGAPNTYASDSLWSYEGGAKIRTLEGKASIEASVFRIDWKGVQTPINLSCGQSFVTSNADARSQGADFQGNIVLFPGFTATVNVGYTDAKYVTGVSSAPGVLLIAAGSEIPYTPKWSYVLGGEYRFPVATHQAYIRADYSHTGKIVTGNGPGTTSYAPDSYNLGGTNLVNARAGITFDKFEISAFVTNLTKSTDLQALNSFASGPGRVTCLNGAACTSYLEYTQGRIDSTFRPRTFGMSIAYRY